MNNLAIRKNIRLKYYDYKQNGYYFVTICCSDMKHNIARYRELTEKILHHLPKIFSGLSIDYFVLMPSHLHIIFVFQNVRDRFARPVSLGEVVRTYKALVTKETKIKNFWQRNYYEHVIRNEEALLKIRGYIQNNPQAAEVNFEEFYKRA